MKNPTLSFSYSRFSKLGMFTSFITCADPGRLNRGSLRQKTLMKLLADGIENLQLISYNKEAPMDILE